MKKLLIVILLFFTVNAIAQQKGISYQAVIYNPRNVSAPGKDLLQTPLSNQKICISFSILDLSANTEYQENQTTTTDEFGMVNLVIGTGNKTGGFANTLSTVNWSLGGKKMVVAINTNGDCSNYTEISREILNYVPYAFYAELGDVADGSITTKKLADGAVTDAKVAPGINKSKVGLGNVDNTSDLNKPISTATQAALDGKLDKILTKPEVIQTTATKTLALNGLQDVDLSTINDQILTINPTTGIISKTSSFLVLKEYVQDIKAIDGQTQFTTSLPIVDINKVNVYRNGVRINLTKVDANTIALESGVVCYQNDEIKIIQFN